MYGSVVERFLACLRGPGFDPQLGRIEEEENPLIDGSLLGLLPSRMQLCDSGS